MCTPDTPKPPDHALCCQNRADTLYCATSACSDISHSWQRAARNEETWFRHISKHYLLTPDHSQTV